MSRLFPSHAPLQESGSSPAPASTITTLHNAAFVVLFIFNFPHVAISLWSHLVHQQCKLHFKVRWCGYSRVPCRHSDSAWRNLRPSHNCILSPPRPPHTAQYWRANSASMPPPLPWPLEVSTKFCGSFHKISRRHFKDLFWPKWPSVKIFEDTDSNFRWAQHTGFKMPVLVDTFNW